MPKKLTTEEFISRARKVHGDRYTYNHVNYKGNDKDVLITCPIHGDFPQTPHNHVLGEQNCPDCARIEMGNRSRKSIETRIKEFNIVHNNKYDYSLITKIKDAFDIIQVICPKHGPFPIRINDHQQGKGCPICGQESSTKAKEKTSLEWINDFKKVHEEEYYDYSLVSLLYNDNEIILSGTKIPILCTIHGVFYQSCSIHKYGKGCPYCSGNASLNNETFLQRAHNKYTNNEYSYPNLNYVNNHTPIIIHCNTCGGEYPQVPMNHLNGAGCPFCLDSNGEKLVKEVLIDNNINFKQEKHISCYSKRGLWLDFYFELNNNKIAIEYQGIQHYEPIEYFGGQKAFELQLIKDEEKRKYCKSNNIKLYEIKYTLTKKEVKKLVVSIIKNP